MNTIEATFRLANIFGLDTDKQQHTVAVADALEDVEDFEDFVGFCREYKETVQYANRLEKLDTLATRYKREQIEKKIDTDKARQYVREISRKAAGCRNIVEEKNALFRNVYLDKKNRLFETHELRALASLGLSTVGIIEASRREELEDMLYDSYVSRKRAILTNQKKPKSLSRIKKI